MAAVFSISVQHSNARPFDPLPYCGRSTAFARGGWRSLLPFDLLYNATC